jgi:hypothetical protein
MYYKILNIYLNYFFTHFIGTLLGTALLHIDTVKVTKQKNYFLVSKRYPYLYYFSDDDICLTNSCCDTIPCCLNFL